MISIWGHGCLPRERPSIALFDSFLLPKLEFSKQLARLLGMKFPATFTDILKYFKNNLKQIFKTILEA